MTSQDAECLGPQRYRVREARVEVCNGYRSWYERRFIAERRVVIFGLRLWWCPVLDAEWRKFIDQACADAAHDVSLRSKPYLKKMLSEPKGGAS